jgi:carbon-monoxide dehydrogenase large subunit
VFVRSPHAHAAIQRIDVSRATAMPGVARVFTGKDIEGKVNGLPCGWLITSTDGTPMKEPPHPVLAQGKVRYVGDHVAMVVADTLEQARNAAEAVVVEYDVLPGRGGRARRRRGHGLARQRARQPLLQVGHRRQVAGGRGLRQGGPRHQAGPGQQPAVPNAMEPRVAIGAFNRATTNTRCTSPTRIRTSSGC